MQKVLSREDHEHGVNRTWEIVRLLDIAFLKKYSVFNNSFEQLKIELPLT